MAEQTFSELGRIEASGLMKEEELELLDISGLRAFMESRLFSRMQRAAEEGLLWREQRFMAAFPASELQPSESDAPQLLQGVIDAYFEEDGELVIVDYKTDRLYEEEAFFEKALSALRVSARAYHRILKVARTIADIRGEQKIGAGFQLIGSVREEIFLKKISDVR